MLPSVVLDDFLHQAVDGSASSGNEVQCFGAIKVRFQCPFNGLDLSGNTFYAFQKIVFISIQTSGSLFIGARSFVGNPSLMDEVKVGVLLGSILSAALGVAVLLSARQAEDTPIGA